MIETTPADQPSDVTCTDTPCDQHGNRIQHGRIYLMYLPRRKAVRVSVVCDPNVDELFYKRVDSDEPWSRVDESDPKARWEVVD